MVATRASAFSVIRILAEYEAQLVNNDGCTALMLAAMSDNGKLCAILAEYEAECVLPDGRDALILAAQIGNLEAIHELVKICNLVQDCNQLTALDHSTNEGHLDCVRVLIRSYEITLEEINYCIIIAEERHYTAILTYLQRVRDGDLSDDPSLFDTTIANETAVVDVTIDEQSPGDHGTGYYHDTMGGSNLTGGVNGVSKARLMKLIESLQEEIADLRQQNSEQRNQLMKYIEKIPTTPIARETSTRNSSICYPHRVLDEVKMNIAADEDLTSPSIDLSYRINENPFMISRVVSQVPIEELLLEKDEEIRRLRAINDDLRLTIQNANFAEYKSYQHPHTVGSAHNSDYHVDPAISTHSPNTLTMDPPLTEEEQNHTTRFTRIDNTQSLEIEAPSPMDGDLNSSAKLSNPQNLIKSDSARKISFSSLKLNFGAQNDAASNLVISPSIGTPKRDEPSFGPSSTSTLSGFSSTENVSATQRQQLRKGKARPYSGSSGKAVFNTELSLKLTQIPPLLNNTFGDYQGGTPSSVIDLCPSRNSSIMGTPNQMSLSFLRGRKPLPQRTPRKSTDTTYRGNRSVNFDSNRTSEVTDAPDIDVPDFPIEAASSTLGSRKAVLRQHIRQSESFQIGSRDSYDVNDYGSATKPRIFSAAARHKVRSHTPQNKVYTRIKGEISEICAYEDLDDSFVEYVKPISSRLLRSKDDEIKRLQDMVEELVADIDSAYHMVQLNHEAVQSFIHNTANNSQQGNAYSFLRISQTSQYNTSVQQLKPAAPRESEADGFIINDHSASIRSAYSPYIHLMSDFREGRDKEGRIIQSLDEPRLSLTAITDHELEEFALANGLRAYITDIRNDFVENGMFNLAVALRELTKIKYAKASSPPKRFSVYRSPSQRSNEDAWKQDAQSLHAAIPCVPLLSVGATGTAPTSPPPAAQSSRDMAAQLSVDRVISCADPQQRAQLSTRYSTPLMVAISERNLDGIRDNMQYAGMVNEFGETALMIAVDLSFADAVKLLIDREAGIATETGLTALQLALQSNNMRIAKLLREKEGVPCDDLTRESGKETDLMYAAEDNNLVNVYCFADVQVRLQDSRGRTALMYAAAASRFEAARILYKLEHGIRGNSGETALMAAAYAGSGSIVRLLVSKESGLVGMYEPEIHEEHSALMIAAYNGHVSCVRILAPSERNLRTPSGLDALFFAENIKQAVSEATKHEIISILQGCAR